MADTDRYVLYQADFNGGTLFDQITDFSINPNTQEIVLRSDGAVHPQFAAIGSQAVTIGFTTNAIKTAIVTNAAGISGLTVTAAIFFFQKILKDGTREATLKHRKLVYGAGILVPRTLSASVGQAASVSYEFFPTASSGTTNPATFTDDQTLGGASGAHEAYTVGVPTLANVAITGVDNVSLDFGINVVQEINGGDVYPTLSYVESAAASLNISTFDTETFKTWNVATNALGTAPYSAVTSVTFKDILAGGIVGSTPVTITGEGGVNMWQGLNASAGNRWQGNIRTLFTLASGGSFLTIA